MNGNEAAHNRELKTILQALARLEPTGHVVSAYLNTQWDDEQQRERLRISVKDRLRALRAAYEGHEEQEGIEASLGRLERFVYDVVKQSDEEMVSADGIAVFASVPRDIWVVFQSPMPFDTEITVSEHPRLGQLTRLHDEYENVFVTLVDPRHLRIFEVFLGGVVTSAELDQYLPDQVDVGGPGHQGSPGMPRGGALSQMRYQRHIDEHRTENLRNAADFLRRLSEREPRSHVILAGDVETTAAFRGLLAPQVEDRVIGEVRLDDKEPRHRVVAKTREVLQRYEREVEEKEVGELVGLAMSGNLGVLGPEDTLMALNEGRVYSLYLGFDAKLEGGWRCLDCRAIGRKAQAGCPYCGGRTTTVDLCEEILRKALDQGARIEHVQHSVRLNHFGGLGARLRHGRQPRSAGLAHGEHYPLPAE